MNTSSEFQYLDINLSQAIQAYRDMDIDEVWQAIVNTWSEQLATFLVAFEFILRIQTTHGLARVIPCESRQGKTHYLALSFLLKVHP